LESDLPSLLYTNTSNEYDVDKFKAGPDITIELKLAGDRKTLSQFKPKLTKDDTVHAHIKLSELLPLFGGKLLSTDEDASNVRLFFTYKKRLYPPFTDAVISALATNTLTDADADAELLSNVAGTVAVKITVYTFP